MSKIILCFTLALLSHVECKPYSSPKPYPDPQRQCRTGHCNVNPSLRFDSAFYPSANQLQRVGVYPGCDADESDEVDYNQPPPPPSPPSDTSNNALPVSVCVQLPPQTALKLPKCVLQQIVFALTKDDNAPVPMPDTTIAPCTETTTTPAPPPPPAPYTQPPPTMPPAPVVYPGYPMVPASSPTSSTTTTKPLVYPPPLSALKQPYKPSSYCGSCRSLFAPRYNKS